MFALLALQDVGEEAVIELRVVDQILQVEGYFRGVQVAQLAVLLVLLEVVLFQQRGRLLAPRVVVQGGEIVVVVVHDDSLFNFVIVHGTGLCMLLIVIHLR